jgi:hypothetical protein
LESQRTIPFVSLSLKWNGKKNRQALTDDSYRIVAMTERQRDRVRDAQMVVLDTVGPEFSNSQLKKKEGNYLIQSAMSDKPAGILNGSLNLTFQNENEEPIEIPGQLETGNGVSPFIYNLQISPEQYDQFKSGELSAKASIEDKAGNRTLVRLNLDNPEGRFKIDGYPMYENTSEEYVQSLNNSENSDFNIKANGSQYSKKAIYAVPKAIYHVESLVRVRKDEEGGTAHLEIFDPKGIRVFHGRQIFVPGQASHTQFHFRLGNQTQTDVIYPVGNYKVTLSLYKENKNGGREVDKSNFTVVGPRQIITKAIQIMNNGTAKPIEDILFFVKPLLPMPERSHNPEICYTLNSGFCTMKGLPVTQGLEIVANGVFVRSFFNLGEITTLEIVGEFDESLNLIRFTAKRF